MRRLALALALHHFRRRRFGTREFHRSTATTAPPRNFRWNDERGVRGQGDDRRARPALASRPTSRTRRSPSSAAARGGYTIDVCKAAARADGPRRHPRRRSTAASCAPPARSNRELDGARIASARRAAPTSTSTPQNGPVAFRDVDGNVVARSANGPLSLQNVSRQRRRDDHERSDQRPRRLGHDEGAGLERTALGRISTATRGSAARSTPRRRTARSA